MVVAISFLSIIQPPQHRGISDGNMPLTLPLGDTVRVFMLLLPYNSKFGDLCFSTFHYVDIDPPFLYISIAAMKNEMKMWKKIF